MNSTVIQYIDKSKVIAEIERIKKEECPIDTYEGRIKLFYFERFLSFLNTLEVKEIQESSAADRGMADEIIFALNTLGKEKMISYDKEIEWLRNKTQKGK